MSRIADLLAEAAARAGPWPGEVPFADTLELLVDSCGATGSLNAVGAQVLHKAAVRHLRNLRQLQAYVADNPGVTEKRIESPVVVTGLPRTGTTLLHNLLALDPSHRVLRFWEALHPIPPGDGDPGLSAATLQAQADRWLDAFYLLIPEFRTIHRATATGPEECDALLQNSFVSQHFDDMFDAERYSAWLATAPLVHEYRHYALQLKVLSTSTTSPLTWALKSPSHLGHVDALLDALPGVTVVICHRHPRQAVASHASLIHALRRTYSDVASPAAVGRQALARAATAMQRALDVRSAIGSPAFVDVAYPALVRDPVATLHAVYDRLGRPLGPEMEERIRKWAVANPQHQHGPHRYDPERFGLTDAAVDAAFAPYLERFGVLVGA